MINSKVLMFRDRIGHVFSSSLNNSKRGVAIVIEIKFVPQKQYNDDGNIASLETSLTLIVRPMKTNYQEIRSDVKVCFRFSFFLHSSWNPVFYLFLVCLFLQESERA